MSIGSLVRCTSGFNVMIKSSPQQITECKDRFEIPAILGKAAQQDFG